MSENLFYRSTLTLLRDFLILILIGNTIGFFLFRNDVYSFPVFFLHSFYSIVVGYPLWKGGEWIVKFLDKRIPWLRHPVKRLFYQIAALILFCTLVIVVFTFFIVLFTSKVSFWNVFSSSIKGLEITLTIMILGTIVTNCVLFFNNWKKAAVQQEKLKLEHLALQYETLKSQVSPHFLFNSLNSLTSLIESDPGKAIQFVKKLSEVYRYMLDQRNNEIVSLDEEMAFVGSYVFLQKIRFQDKLIVSINLKTMRGSKVIPLSLQMLVENAIKHNVISSEQPLKIEISDTGDGYLRVRNNIRPRTPAQGSTGVGLDNIKKRYEFFTNRPVRISVDSGYFSVEIPEIPD